MDINLVVPEKGGMDFIALGALIHRLDPGVVPFRKAVECQIHVSGGEYNVAANLAYCFRQQSGIVSAMVDYPIGELIADRVRSMGVKPYYKWFEHDGVNGPNMATVYSDRGQGVRGPVVFYNRANEAAARLKPGDFDWREIFAGGVRWFHSGGIFASLSETTGELIIEGMQAARAHGAVVSFDINYRPRLWNIWSDERHALTTLRRIIEQVDVLIAGEEDLEQRLGLAAAGVTKKSSMDPGRFFSLSEEAAKKYPGIRVVATTMREVHSTNRHAWSGAAWMGGERYTAPTCELDVLDRIGSGDGFVAGLFYGLLTGCEPQEVVNLGWAHGALVSTYPGDVSMASLEEVQAIARGESAQVQR